MNYPLTKKVCQLNEQGIYVGVTVADLSPEEAENGVYLMPAGCVDIEPPKEKKGFVAKWTGEGWEYIENHIGETVYSTTTKESLVISEFGSIPDGYTAAKPESDLCEWDGKAWSISKKNQTELFNQQKEILILQLAAKTDELKAGLLVGYSQTEIDSFYRQEKEALAWQADKKAETPMLKKIAELRGVPFEVLVEKVIEKSNILADTIGAIIGIRQKLEDRINAAEEQVELDAIKNEVEKWQLQKAN